MQNVCIEVKSNTEHSLPLVRYMYNRGHYYYISLVESKYLVNQ